MQNINIRNKKAGFNFTLIEKYIAGIKLTGTEIKSIRLGKVSISESYCYFNDGELFVKGMSISDYGYGSSHDSNRDKKLLLKRKELNKLEKELVNGLTIIPYRVFINDLGLVKVDIVLSKGKKIYDKREHIKNKDIQRDIDRELK